MGTCINHPDRETPYICMKHQIYLCEDCLECRDPKIYCKHRSACPIWFMGKRKVGWKAEDRQAAAVANPTATFPTDGQTVSVCGGSTLLEAAHAGEVNANTPCSRKGAGVKQSLSADTLRPIG